MADGLLGAAGKISNFFNPGFKDREVSAFTKTNLRYTENDLLKFQDPTYLGFKLFFLFDQPESGLLSTIPHPNTALAYLEARGYTQRANYLKQFVTLLQRINSECPWFWQSIKGLDEAWKHGFNEDVFIASIATDRKIIISTLDESIDLRMTALMDLYRKACFDWPNRREVVPRNLRFFSVAIYCYEARSINRNTSLNFGLDTLATAAAGENPLTSLTKEITKMQKLLGNDESDSDPLTSKVTTINDKTSRLMFDFNYCEWLPDESGVVVTDLSVKELALKAQQLVFKYRSVAEDNVYRMFSDSKVSDLFVGALDSLALDSPADALKALAKAKLEKIARSKLNNLFLGNAYGFSPIAAVNAIIADPKQVVAVVKDVLPTSSLKNDTKDVTNGKLGKSFDLTTASLSNNKKAVFPPNQNIIFENKSLTNASKDELGSIKDNPYPGSISLTNETEDLIKPRDNPYPGSKSLTNASNDELGPIKDNPYPGSESLTNESKDELGSIKDNPYPGSKSLTNGKDVDAKGNAYK